MATQGQLKCPICLNLLDKPKILSCSHIFCKRCLTTLYRAQTGRDRICCPLCRKTTDVAGGDVSKLNDSLAAQSLIDAKVHPCTICSDKKSAVAFCADCDEYICDSCKQKHDDWNNFFGHEQFSIEEVNAGKPGTKKKEKCNRHGKEEMNMCCLNCKIYICPRCRMEGHPKHDVIEAEDHEKGYKEKIAALMARAVTKKTRLSKHAAFIKEQQTKVHDAVQEPIKEIEAACERVIRQIKQSSDRLVSKCKKHEQRITSQLEGMVSENDMQIVCIENACELVKNGTLGRLDRDSLVAHDTMREDFEKLLEGREVDYLRIDNLSRHAAGLAFKPKGDVKHLEIGFLMHEQALKLKDNMRAMATTPDGRMAVGYKRGGIEIYSAEGQRQQTVLADEEIYGIGFLSDGRYAVRNSGNNVSLYTSEWEKDNVGFETISHGEGGTGNLTVDCDDQIYVSYSKAMKIQVFTPAGGKAVREIPCDGYAPWQIFTMKSSKRLLVGDVRNSVIVIDESGEKKHEVVNYGDNYNAFPCVSKDGSILTALVRHEEGLVSIDRYTDELQHVQTLITDHKIEIPDVHLYHLQEFLSGEIAFCHRTMLYIFRVDL